MSDQPESEPEDEERTPMGWKAIAAAVLLLLLFGLILFGGLRGCATEDPQEAAKREEQAKKGEKEKDKQKQQQEDPKVSEPIVLPNEPVIFEQHVKPGHWASASQRMQARERDFFGHTRTAVYDEKKTQLPIEETPFRLQSTRPAALAKGTTKFVDSTFFVPQSVPQGDEKTAMLTTEFDEGGLGFARPWTATLQLMLPHQYHFVVLAKEPDRYSLIKTLDSIQSPYKGEPGVPYMSFDPRESVHYRVSLLEPLRSVPLPDSPLMWTSIAYLLWDEVDPEPFTPEQERALVDWLHWGGQLIVNGPDSLDLIRGSFLEPFMPATSGGPREIAASDLRTLSENWTISAPRRTGVHLQPVTPWSGITLTLTPTAGADKSLWESTGGLLAERTVGRGRVVVSAMQLSERELANWGSGFQSLFNACILRRPPRVYRQVDIDTASLVWDTTSDPSLKDRRLDARLNTALRFFTRDLGVETSYQWGQQGRDVPVQPTRRTRYSMGPAPAGMGQQTEYLPPSNPGGIGAWNDFNDTARDARAALREAAGVDVPNRTFVVASLAAYLIVLVPINWLVFHMLGRVEWAWIAAPLIALVGTYIVVQRAQLDIGFVRSQTEIGLLELQPDHRRAHLARFTALYTSLSTTYDLHFDTTTALALPFPRAANDPTLRGQGYTTIDFQRQAEGVRLSGLPVLSNSTNFVHSEQMFTLDGPIRIGRSAATGGSQIENLSQLRLRSAGIVRKQGGTQQGIWIGELGPGKSASIPDLNHFPSLADGARPFDIERTAEAQLTTGPRLNLEPLMKLAYDPANADEGETRLVARVDEPLAGETVSPAASQLRSGTLVVAHLRYGPLPPLRHDQNTRQDVRMQSEDELR
ncbi:MAG: hypothetical protein WD669_09160 [Pirellulales bacterium]